MTSFNHWSDHYQSRHSHCPVTSSSNVDKSPVNVVNVVGGLLKPPATYRRSLTSTSLHHTTWTGVSPIKCVTNVQVNI